jgi:hypothetical protein
LERRFDKNSPRASPSSRFDNMEPTPVPEEPKVVPESQRRSAEKLRRRRKPEPVEEEQIVDTPSKVQRKRKAGELAPPANLEQIVADAFTAAKRLQTEGTGSMFVRHRGVTLYGIILSCYSSDVTLRTGATSRKTSFAIYIGSVPKEMPLSSVLANFGYYEETTGELQLLVMKGKRENESKNKETAHDNALIPYRSDGMPLAPEPQEGQGDKLRFVPIAPGRVYTMSIFRDIDVTNCFVVCHDVKAKEFTARTGAILVSLNCEGIQPVIRLTPESAFHILCALPNRSSLEPPWHRSQIQRAISGGIMFAVPSTGRDLPTAGVFARLNVDYRMTTFTRMGDNVPHLFFSAVAVLTEARTGRCAAVGMKVYEEMLLRFGVRNVELWSMVVVPWLALVDMTVVGDLAEAQESPDDQLVFCGVLYVRNIYVDLVTTLEERAVPVSADWVALKLQHDPVQVTVERPSTKGATCTPRVVCFNEARQRRRQKLIKRVQKGEGDFRVIPRGMQTDTAPDFSEMADADGETWIERSMPGCRQFCVYFVLKEGIAPVARPPPSAIGTFVDNVLGEKAPRPLVGAVQAMIQSVTDE